MGNREQVAELKSQVALMMGMRVKQRVMAKQLGVSAARIGQLMRVIRLERAAEDKKLPTAAVVGGVLNEQDVAVRKLWSIVNDDRASLREKIFALGKLKVERDFSVGLYQIVGVLPRDNINFIEAQAGSVVAVGEEIDVNVFERVLVIKKAEAAALKALDAESAEARGDVVSNSDDEDVVSKKGENDAESDN